MPYAVYVMIAQLHMLNTQCEDMISILAKFL